MVLKEDGPLVAPDPSQSVPTTPDEAAVALALLRAAWAGLLAGRKGQRVTITKRQRERAYGVLLRMAMTQDEAIHLWLDKPAPDMRTGVVYLGWTEDD